MANRHHCSNNVFPPSFFFLFFVFFFFVVFFFKDCPAGWLNPDNKIAAVNHQSCDRCPQSLPVSGVGAFYCFGCPAGWLKNNDGAAACIACLAGTQGNSEGTLCSNCSAGTYQPNNGTAFCLPCIPGMYSNQPMSIKCQICEQNKYSNRTLQTVCENCPEGKKSLPGSASCIPCDAGKQEILYSATPFVVVGGIWPLVIFHVLFTHEKKKDKLEKHAKIVRQGNLGRVSRKYLIVQRCCWWYLTTCYFPFLFRKRWTSKILSGLPQGLLPKCK